VVLRMILKTLIPVPFVVLGVVLMA